MQPATTLPTTRPKLEARAGRGPARGTTLANARVASRAPRRTRLHPQCILGRSTSSALRHSIRVGSVHGIASLLCDCPQYCGWGTREAWLYSHDWRRTWPDGSGESRCQESRAGRSVGCNIELPIEQTANRYVDRSVTVHYFFVRKVLLFRYSYAFVALPGGLGRS